MIWKPVFAVWELTLKCNMRCRHCGSSADKARPDELSTEEALLLCDNLGALKTEQLTLLGGEPFLRKDWPLLAERLSTKGVKVNAITNGFLMNDALAQMTKDAGLTNVAVSIDGMAETHDWIRNIKNSWQRALQALSILAEHEMSPAVVTTVTKRSLHELEDIHTVLVGRDIPQWQIQIAAPHGRMKDFSEFLIEKDDMLFLSDFITKKKQENLLRIDAADCIGYFGKDENRIREKKDPQNGVNQKKIPFWTGCLAGLYGIGITSDGGIKGCLSLISDEFLEGNVRERNLKDIWHAPDAFAWNRKYDPDLMTGACSDCEYKYLCKAGCTSTKVALTGDIYEYPLCIRAIEAEKAA